MNRRRNRNQEFKKRRLTTAERKAEMEGRALAFSDIPDGAFLAAMEEGGFSVEDLAEGDFEGPW